jgi:hypothetical protein
MHTIKEVEDHFAGGAESVTLTRAEWLSIQEISRGYFANGIEVSHARAEAERVKRIARQLWRACKIVSRQMRACACSASRPRVMDWEMRLRHATTVDWRDLPPEQRPPSRAYR